MVACLLPIIAQSGQSLVVQVCLIVHLTIQHPTDYSPVGFQPGWFQGHAVAFIYVNIGITGPDMLAPPNMSHNVVPPFQIVGPSNSAYNGSVCLPQVPLPASTGLQIGDNITIQLVQSAQHGAALYSVCLRPLCPRRNNNADLLQCVDVTLADPADVAPVTADNCVNTSNIGINYLYTTSALTSGSFPTSRPSMIMTFWTLMIAITGALTLF